MSTEIAYPAWLGRERSERHPLAFAVGFFLSFRLAIVLVSVDVLGLQASTGTALSLGLDSALLGVIGFASPGAGQAGAGSMLRVRPVRWVIAYLGFCLLSLTWSESASLTNSSAYWLGLAIDVANVILLLRGGSGAKGADLHLDSRAESQAHSLLSGFIWSSCLLALAAWLMPVQPDLRLGDEQFFTTNEIGNVCALAIFFAQYLTRRGQGRWLFAKGFLLVTLIRSLSKSTLAAFVVSEGLLLLFDRSTSRKTKMLLIGGTLALILAFWGLFEAYYSVYTTAGNQAETVTGRTAIWLYVLNATFDHPWTLWIGHGFDSWWKVVPAFGSEKFEARHAEDELLQQFYAFGIAGVVFLGGIYGSLFRQIRKLAKGPARLVFLAMVVFVVVRGLAVADAFDLLLPLWTIVLIGVIAANSGTSRTGQ